MIAIELDAVQQKRLDDLARSQGEDGASFARRILLDYLDFLTLPSESDEVWAEASVALSPEIMIQEEWGSAEHGS